VISGAATAAERIALQQTDPFAPFNLPPGTSYQRTPYGTIVATAGSAPVSPLTSSIGSLGSLPILLIGGLFVVMMLARK
jgi:hypothetical protein